MAEAYFDPTNYSIGQHRRRSNPVNHVVHFQESGTVTLMTDMRREPTIPLRSTILLMPHHRERLHQTIERHPLRFVPAIKNRLNDLGGQQRQT